MIKSLFPRLTVPENIIFRKGCLATLAKIEAKRILLVVGGRSARASGALDQVQKYAKGNHGGEVTVFSEITSEPTWAMVQAGAGRARDIQADWIVGLGGGSVMDAAKLMFALHEQPEMTLDLVARPFSMPTLRNKSQLCLIPTTSGSGAEVSSAAVLNDNDKKIKRIIVSHELLPDLALLDPCLTISLSPSVTAHSGMDAFTHAVEAFVSTAHNPFSDAMATHAARLILKNLGTCFCHGEDLPAREEMQFASCLAGIAQNNVAVGLTHAIAHKLGVMLDLPHGLLNSLFLLPVMRFNAERVPARYNELAQACGFQTYDDLIATVTSLQRDLKLPTTLREAGRDIDSISGMREEIVKDILSDICIRTNPRKPGPETIWPLIESVS